MQNQCAQPKWVRLRWLVEVGGSKIHGTFCSWFNWAIIVSLRYSVASSPKPESYWQNPDRAKQYPSGGYARVRKATVRVCNGDRIPSGAQVDTKVSKLHGRRGVAKELVQLRVGVDDASRG